MSSEIFMTQIAYTSYCLHRNLEGISREDSVRQPEGGGNCLNWVVGHIVATRNRWLTGLGLEPVIADRVAERYRRGGEPIAESSQATALDELLAAYDRSQEILNEALGSMSEEQLDGPAPFSPGDNPEETWRSLNSALCFHEAYHTGQTGTGRRAIGKPGVLT